MPKLYYIANPSSLGDIVSHTPVMREFHDVEGFAVYAVVPERNAGVLRGLPFVQGVITGSKWGVHDEFPWSDCPFTLNFSVVKEIGEADDAIVVSNFVLDETQATWLRRRHIPVYDMAHKYHPRNTSPWPSRLPKCRTELHASRANILPSDNRMDIHFEREAVQLPADKPTVMLYIGTLHKARRLHPELVNAIIEILSSDFHVILEGMQHHYDDIGLLNVEKCIDLISHDRSPKYSLPLVLSYMEASDYVVTIDSGMMFCSLALNKPTVILESMVFTEYLVGEYYVDQVRPVASFDTNCHRTCCACYCEDKFLIPRTRSRLTFPDGFDTTVQHLDERAELPCMSLQKYSVPCMTEIKPSHVLQAIYDLRETAATTCKKIPRLPQP